MKSIISVLILFFGFVIIFSESLHEDVKNLFNNNIENNDSTNQIFTNEPIAFSGTGHSSFTREQEREIALLTTMLIGECNTCSDQEQDSIIQVAINRAHIGFRGASNLFEVLLDKNQFQALQTYERTYEKCSKAYKRNRKTTITHFMSNHPNYLNNKRMKYICGKSDFDFHHNFYSEKEE